MSGEGVHHANDTVAPEAAPTTALTDLERAYRSGIRASIAWLHAEALTMNDPHAQQVLNNAAFGLGVAKPRPKRRLETNSKRTPSTT